MLRTITAAIILTLSLTANAKFVPNMTFDMIKKEVSVQLANQVPPKKILQEAKSVGYNITNYLISIGIDPTVLGDAPSAGEVTVSFAPSRTSGIQGSVNALSKN